MEMNNQQLLAKLKSGDEDAFKLVFEEYFPKMKYFANEYLNDLDDASDVVQNTFAILWEKRTLLADDTHFFNFLLSLVKNQCVDFLRKKQSQQKYIEQSQDIYEENFSLNLYALENLEVNQVFLSELEEKIQHAIDTLPDVNRRTFILSRHDGLKYAEIAEKLNVSTKTVEKRISASLIHIRERLNRYFV